MRAVMVALTNRSSTATDEQFNEWYDKIHVPEVLAVEGFTGVSRYRASQVGTGLDSGMHEYLAVYDIETADLDEVRERMIRAMPSWQPTDVLDTDSRAIAFFELVSDHSRAVE
ncbi:hypothetical protein [Nocardia sp. SC052]|uniref:hypothetical protein n=1 Tax=Nocardia sichangensis TaxID=3385975 RepID=UPI0039A1298A